MQVREVMTRDALVASPDDTIQKAATLMAQVNCSRRRTMASVHAAAWG
jgi:predicted transcriptional regulator